MPGDGGSGAGAQREYLKDRLLMPLSLGLAELCHVRPADPLQYLADWLRHHRTMQLKKGEVVDEQLVYEGKRLQERLEKLHTKESDQVDCGATSNTAAPAEKKPQPSQEEVEVTPPAEPDQMEEKPQPSQEEVEVTPQAEPDDTMRATETDDSAIGIILRDSGNADTTTMSISSVREVVANVVVEEEGGTTTVEVETSEVVVVEENDSAGTTEGVDEAEGAAIVDEDGGDATEDGAVAAVEEADVAATVSDEAAAGEVDNDD